MEESKLEMRIIFELWISLRKNYGKSNSLEIRRHENWKIDIEEAVESKILCRCVRKAV